MHPKPFHTAKQCEEGSDSHVNKVLETIGIEYTKKLLQHYKNKPTLHPYWDQHEYSGHTDYQVIWIAWYMC